MNGFFLTFPCREGGSLKGFNLWRVHQPLTNWASWNNHDKQSKNANTSLSDVFTPIAVQSTILVKTFGTLIHTQALNHTFTFTFTPDPPPPPPPGRYWPKSLEGFLLATAWVACNCHDHHSFNFSLCSSHIYDFHIFITSLSSFHRFKTKQFYDLVPVGSLA